MVRYLQVDGGQKLHLVYEAGEGLIPFGFISHPLCGRKLNNQNYRHGYRMTCYFPLGNACKKCLRIYGHQEASDE